jgi:predicted PurR-regulated permease PerM
MFWLIGTKVQEQVVELMDTLPSTIENAKEKLSQNEIGKKIIENITSKHSMEKAQGLAQRFFRSTFGLLGDLYVILFVALFFTVSPKTYVDGIIRLVPPKGQKKASDVLAKLADHLNPRPATS